MAQNWWDSAPIVQQPQNGRSNWWESAPLAQQPEQINDAGIQKRREALERALSDADQRVKQTEGIGGVLRVLPKTIRGTALNAAQGATLGFADEALAGLAALPKAAIEGKGLGQAYGDALQGIRGFEKDVHDTSPAAATISQIGGGLLTAGAGSAGNIVRGAEALKAAGAGPIRQALSSILRGAASGAGVGAVQGFGEGEGGLENRALGAGIGGVVGGLTGAALPAGAVLGKRAMTAAGNIASGALSPGRRAMGLAREVLDNAGLNTPEAVMTRLEELGPTATLADIGKRGQRLARTLMDMPGKGGEHIGDVLEKRAADRADRLVTEAGSTLNPQGKSFYGSLDEIAAAKKQKAAPLYEEAHTMEIPFTENLQKVLQTPAGKQAWGKAQAIAANEGRTLPKIISAENGEINISSVPDMQTWDYLKRGLDDVIERNSDPLSGKVKTDLGRSVVNVKNKLLNELDTLNPKYKEARSVFAGQAEIKDALEQGREFTKLDPEEIRKSISGMDETSQAAFKTGVMRALEDSKERLSGSLRKSKNSEQLKAVFGNDDAFQKFMKRAEGEKIQAKTEAGAGGSRTASSLSDIEDFQQKTGMLSSLLRGDLWGAGAQALGKGGALATGLSQRVGEELAPILMGRDPKVIGDILKRSAPGKAAGRKSALAGVSLGQALARYNAGNYK